MHMHTELEAKDEDCPRCDDDTTVWFFDKDECAKVKRCYTCDNCGHEWSEFMDWDER